MSQKLPLLDKSIIKQSSLAFKIPYGWTGQILDPCALAATTNEPIGGNETWLTNLIDGTITAEQAYELYLLRIYD